MDRAEIIAFLKENLSVDLEIGNERDFGKMSLNIKVSISLDGEKITEGSDYIDIASLQP